MAPVPRDFGLFAIGLDGSPESEHAQLVAADLASRCGARLTGVSADGAVLVPEGSRRIPGVPGIELPRYAESVGAELLVLGRRPRSPSGPPLGATGDAVVRRSRVPCLLIPTHVTGLRRILLALDPGPRGGAVRAFTEAFAAAVGAELRSVTVRRAAATAPGHPRRQPRVDTGPGRNDAGHGLHRWREGVFSTEILAEAAEVGADAIAFGVHRGGQLGGVEQEGVSHHLVREAPTALLTVPL